MKKVILAFTMLLLVAPTLCAKMTKRSKSNSVLKQMIEFMPLALKQKQDAASKELVCPPVEETSKYLVMTGSGDKTTLTVDIQPSDKYYDCVVMQSFGVMFVYYKIIWDYLANYMGDYPTNLTSDYSPGANKISLTYNFYPVFEKKIVDSGILGGSKSFENKFVGKESAMVVNEFFNSFLNKYLRSYVDDRSTAYAPAIGDLPNIFINEGKYYTHKKNALEAKIK